MVTGLERLLSDPVLRDQLGGKAQARSVEFSWQQSADAMRRVLDSMLAGTRASGVI
jgi:glycosyltransferase involved in cell wall biosynthesis